MKRSMIRLALGLAALLLIQPAFARTFSNAYVSFELPDSWNCVLEQTEWVCRPVAPQLQQLGIIILTAKEVGPSDSNPQYKAHLQQPRIIMGRNGQPLNSTVLKVEERQINGQVWVDGMHNSSEVPNFFTRYLATTKDQKIAVLVTFTAHTQHYTKFQTAFLAAIASLRVTATKSMLGGRDGSGGGGMFGQGMGGSLSGLEGLPEEGEAGDGGGGLSEKAQMILGIAAVLAGIGIYLMLKRGRKKR
ncbi:MAG: hypothetical protein V4760_15925 [Bdellovibrionota bacterium]